MKPLKGVITDWYYAGTHIRGKAAFHVDAVAIKQALAAPDNPIVEGLDIATSAVETMQKKDGFTICETRNSLYVLLGDPMR